MSSNFEWHTRMLWLKFFLFFIFWLKFSNPFILWTRLSLLESSIMSLYVKYCPRIKSFIHELMHFSPLFNLRCMCIHVHTCSSTPVEVRVDLIINFLAVFLIAPYLNADANDLTMPLRICWFCDLSLISLFRLFVCSERSPAEPVCCVPAPCLLPL